MLRSEPFAAMKRTPPARKDTFLLNWCPRPGKGWCEDYRVLIWWPPMIRSSSETSSSSSDSLRMSWDAPLTSLLVCRRSPPRPVQPPLQHSGKFYPGHSVRKASNAVRICGTYRLKKGASFTSIILDTTPPPAVIPKYWRSSLISRRPSGPPTT